MSALTLTLKYRPYQRVDMSPLVCNKLLDKTPTDIAALTLQSGKQKIRVDELFEISGEDCQHIFIKDSCEKLDSIGKELDRGEMIIEGDVGAYLAMAMQGGSITVRGNSGIFTACELKDGLVQIDGNTDDFVGAALTGNKLGMQGGMVLVKGNVGARVGDHMRRGIILVEGNAGDYLGSRMTAGTIAVMGEVGRHIGYAMRRGTLLLWQQPDLPANFKDCGSHTLAFLPLLFSSFKELDSKFAATRTVSFNRVHKWGGDIAEMGRGEVLVKIGNE
jgi:formylmethanofuran dehydrogenase subunit C